jgi:putative endonuclease
MGLLQNYFSFSSRGSLSFILQKPRNLYKPSHHKVAMMWYTLSICKKIKKVHEIGRKKKMDEKSFVYIVECSDGTFYTGWTNNIEKRLQAHNSGKGAKYTRGRTPVILRYLEELENRSSGLKREAKIKKLSRSQKETLIKEGTLKKEF